MSKFSWSQWLSSAIGRVITSQRRKRRTRLAARLEGLENRVVLSAHLPVAVNDSGYVIFENGVLTGSSVLANDTDEDGDTIDTAILDNGPANGTVTLNSNGTFVYFPDTNFIGTDSFTYFAQDSTNNEISASPATVTITVGSSSGSPVANSATFDVTENTTFQGTLSAFDPQGDSLTFLGGSTNPVNGDLFITFDGNFTYTPDPGFVGTDSFTFYVTDGSTNSEEATVVLHVAAAEENTLPIAQPQSLTTSANTALAGQLTASDADGDTLTYEIATFSPIHGSVVLDSDGSFVYTPDQNFTGTDFFTFHANDGTGNSEDEPVTITVTASGSQPTASAANFTISPGSTLTGTLTGSDPEGDPLTFQAGSQAPAHGNVSIGADGSFSYQPTSGFSGVDTFTFTVSDGSQTSNEATVTVNVTAENGMPSASPASYTITPNMTLNGTLNGSDPEGDDLTFQAGTVTPSHGSVTISPTGSFMYIPDANFFGTDSFSFKVNDGTQSSPEATVSITVTFTNDPPTANSQTLTTAVNATLNGTLTGTDPEGATLTFMPGTLSPSHGTVSIQPSGMFTYTPATNFTGTDRFSFRVSDGTSTSSSATVTIIVGGSSSGGAPTVTNGSAELDENTSYTDSLSPLASDPDGDELSFVAVTQPSHGTLSLNPDGVFLYIPDTGFAGSDSFTFRANDGTSTSNTGTFTLNVGATTSDTLTLTLPGSSPTVRRNNTKVRLDPQAELTSNGSLSYADAIIRITIESGNTDADERNLRVTLGVQNQGTGAGLVKVKGNKIYYDGSRTPIARRSGGTNKAPMVLVFTDAATEEAVQAVLRQISLQASKKASTGPRQVRMEVFAGDETSEGLKTVNIV